MVLEKIRLDKKSRYERKVDREIKSISDAFAHQLSQGEFVGQPLTINVGKTPENMSVFAYARSIGEFVMDVSLPRETSMGLATFNLEATHYANIMKPGVNEDNFDMIPPPPADVSVFFDRTKLAELYKF